MRGMRSLDNDRGHPTDSELRRGLGNRYIHVFSIAIETLVLGLSLQYAVHPEVVILHVLATAVRTV